MLWLIEILHNSCFFLNNSLWIRPDQLVTCIDSAAAIALRRREISSELKINCSGLSIHQLLFIYLLRLDIWIGNDYSLEGIWARSP